MKFLVACSQGMAASRTARAAASWPRLHALGTSSQGVSQWAGSVAWGRCSYMAFAAASTASSGMVTGGLLFMVGKGMDDGLKYVVFESLVGG